MPTGYTSKLYDGEQSFEEFFWGCARGIGLLVMMRDEPLDEPIPEKFDASTHCRERADSYRRELAAIKKMTAKQCAERVEREYEEALAEHVKDIATLAKRTLRFQRMRERVEAWQPPLPDYAQFKKFMLGQLDTETAHLVPEIRRSSEPPRRGKMRRSRA